MADSRKKRRSIEEGPGQQKKQRMASEEAPSANLVKVSSVVKPQLSAPVIGD